jgi:hypothetical protein
MNMHAESILIQQKRRRNTALLLGLSIVLGIAILFLSKALDNRFLVSLGHILTITGGIWIICRSYVQFLWRRYPWATHPRIHIVLEVLGIGLLTTLFGFALYTTELRLGLMGPAEGLGMQVIITLLITYLITGIHEMVYFYQQWIHHFSKSVRLERDNIEAKYESLKTQVNPHFLFNSLNSLTTLVEDNRKAVDYIQNLSGFLRYLLGSSNRDLVYLKEELQVMNQYLELQKSRFQENLVVVIEVAEKYHLYTLPPLALQMLMENCIKHNVISSEDPLTIHIKTEEGSLLVTNKLQKKTGVSSTGQGLNNIVERYRHFTPRPVKIRETEDEFSVSLPLVIMEI